MWNIDLPFRGSPASCIVPLWACLCMSLVSFGYSGDEWFAHMSLQSEASFYSPITISRWANVLGIGVQRIAFVSWSLLLASNPKETLPSLYFSLHFKEFYRFLSYILLHYKFEFIFLYKILNFQWSSLLLQHHLLREFISFIDPFTLYLKPTSCTVLISLRALEEFYLPICPYYVSPLVDFAMQYSLSSNPPSSCLSLHVSRTMCMYDGTWWC